MIPPAPPDSAPPEPAPSNAHTTSNFLAQFDLSSFYLDYNQRGHQFNALGLGIAMLFLPGGDSSPVALDFGGWGTGGWDQNGSVNAAYDSHFGAGLGFVTNVVAGSLVAGVGGDSANLGESSGFYGYSDARLFLNWADAFRMEGSFGGLLRATETNELRAKAGVGLGCASLSDGDPTCAQLHVDWLWFDYPGTNSSAMGAMVSFGLFGATSSP